MSSSDRRPLTVEDFEKIKLIGKGGFGEVFLVRGKKSAFKDKQYAMKKIKKNDMRVDLEINALKTLSSSSDTAANRIVKFRIDFYDNDYTYIIMDYCKGGSLREYIKQKGQPLQQCVAADVLCELVEGVTFMHKFGVTHRDLTAGNVLIDGKEPIRVHEGIEYEYLHVKIADFGLTKRTPSRPAAQTCVGTPGYMAQEIRDRTTYDETVDVFSLGAILYFMLLRKDPPPNLQYDKDKRPVFTDRFFDYKGEAQDLILRLMSKKEVRIKLEEIERHLFTVNNNLENLQIKNVITKRGSSVEQRQANSRNSASENIGARLSAGFGSNNNETRQSRPPLVERQFRQPEPRRTRPTTTGTTGASGDSAFWSGDRQRRPSASQCSHRGVCVGQRCSCGYIVGGMAQVQRRPSVDRFYKSEEPAAFRRPSMTANTHQTRPAFSNGSLNRVSRPPSMDNRPSTESQMYTIRGMSTPSTSSNTTNDQKADPLEWPVPYVGCFVRGSERDYRFLNFTGRYIVYSTDRPSIVFEMFNDVGVELIFQIYGNNPGNEQRVVVYDPLEKTTPELNEKFMTSLKNRKGAPDSGFLKKREEFMKSALIEKREPYQYRLRSREDLEKYPNLLRGYRFINRFVQLMRRKQWRRRMRDMYGYRDYHMELKYDGTIVMNCPGSRQVTKMQDGTYEKVDTLNKVERMLFNLGVSDLSKAHESAIYQEKNLPRDPELSLRALMLITKPTEIIEAPCETPRGKPSSNVR